MSPVPLPPTKLLTREERFGLLEGLIRSSDAGEQKKLLVKLDKGIKSFEDLQVPLADIVERYSDMNALAKLYSMLARASNWSAKRVIFSKLPFQMLISAYILEAPGDPKPAELLDFIRQRPAVASKICKEITGKIKLDTASNGRLAQITSAIEQTAQHLAGRQIARRAQEKFKHQPASLDITFSNLSARTERLIAEPGFANRSISILIAKERKDGESFGNSDKALIRMLAQKIPEHLKKFPENKDAIANHILALLSADKLTEVQACILGNLYAQLKGEFAEVVEPIKRYFNDASKPKLSRVQILSAYYCSGDAGRDDYFDYALEIFRGSDLKKREMLLDGIFYDKIGKSYCRNELPLGIAVECQLLIDLKPSSRPNYVIAKSEYALRRWKKEVPAVTPLIEGDDERMKVLARLLNPKIDRLANFRNFKKHRENYEKKPPKDLAI